MLIKHNVTLHVSNKLMFHLRCDASFPVYWQTFCQVGTQLQHPCCTIYRTRKTCGLCIAARHAHILSTPA